MRTIVFTVLATGLAACSQSPPSLGPRAEVTTSTIDFGAVSPCAAARGRFQVRNSGGLPLQLEVAGGAIGYAN